MTRARSIRVVAQGVRKAPPQPYELPSARQLAAYVCQRGHAFTVPFAADAEPPAEWRHRCGADATLDSGDAVPPAGESEHDRCMQLIRMRRTDAQGAALLAERLAEHAAAMTELQRQLTETAARASVPDAR